MSDTYCLKLCCYNCNSSFKKNIKKGFKIDAGVIIPDGYSYFVAIEEEAAIEKKIYERIFCPTCNCRSLAHSVFVNPITH